MRFDVDMNSEQAELFIKVREFIISEIQNQDTKAIEKFSQNITSFYCKEYKTGFCYIKTKDDYVHLGWFQGVNLVDKTEQLFGSGKNIRAQKIKTFSKIEKDAMASYIKQTFILMMEHEERQILRNQLKAKR
ncbi:hypothetical protein [Sulfurimonas sp.]|uniref:hypothetical protein n=1 Tax=Sulfurimonas sp. TaxID=2022749 RepID=UPI0025FB318C|nr:hypothetical protein [Sulfurimonas sp.]